MYPFVVSVGIVSDELPHLQELRVAPCIQVLGGAYFFEAYIQQKSRREGGGFTVCILLVAMPEGGISIVAPGNAMHKAPGIGMATLRAIKSAPSAFVVPCKNEESSILVPAAIAEYSAVPLDELMNGRAEREENGGGIDDPLAAAAAAEASTGGSIVMPLMVGDPKQSNRIAKQKAKVRMSCAKWLLHS